MKPADLLSLLRDVYADKLSLYRRHELGALRVSGYEFNNTYQYILNREAEHLSWLRAAIGDFGAIPADTSAELPLPGLVKGEQPDAAVFEGDARSAAAFVEKWRPRIDAVTHASHRKMLELMLGEVCEQQRFFEQALTGQDDLLGRRLAGSGTGGGVMSTRWIE